MYIIAIITVGSILVFISYNFESSNVCPIHQMSIVGQVEKYEVTKDPQTCDILNMKISQFNSQCKSDIEELDCG